MGTLTVNSFIGRLQSAMRDMDSGQRRWTDDDIAQYVSDGQRSAVQLSDLRSTPARATSSSPPARNRASLPTAFNLLNMVRNMGDQHGMTPGRSIRYSGPSTT